MIRNKGFTLIEVIISIFILSIISVAALGSFQQMIRAKEVQKEHEIILTSLSFAYTTLLNDVTQQVDVDTSWVFSEQDISFFRASSDKTSDTVKVQYTWPKDELVREEWQGEQYRSQTLLKKIKSIQWQWISTDTWHDVSVPLQEKDQVKAWKLIFNHDTAGEITWIFAHP